MSYNEADTRAKLIDPALHAQQWIARDRGPRDRDTSCVSTFTGLFVLQL